MLRLQSLHGLLRDQDRLVINWATWQLSFLDLFLGLFLHFVMMFYVQFVHLFVRLFLRFTDHFLELGDGFRISGCGTVGQLSSFLGRVRRHNDMLDVLRHRQVVIRRLDHAAKHRWLGTKWLTIKELLWFCATCSLCLTHVLRWVFFASFCLFEELLHLVTSACHDFLSCVLGELVGAKLARDVIGKGALDCGSLDSHWLQWIVEQLRLGRRHWVTKKAILISSTAICCAWER